MLVLSRKPNEQIVIGEGVRLTVLSVRGNRVQLGIEAPIEMPVLRSELVEQDVDHSDEHVRGLALAAH